jgi:hypothetical protein
MTRISLVSKLGFVVLWVSIMQFYGLESSDFKDLGTVRALDDLPLVRMLNLNKFLASGAGSHSYFNHFGASLKMT